MLISEAERKNSKLTTEQRTEIFEKYKTGDYSQRELAREYNVSRRLITFIIDPQKMLDNLKRRDERGGSTQYYNKENHTEKTRVHRRYKQELYLKGLLIEK